MLAAAHSLNTKKKRFSGKLAADIKAYLDSLLLGQTEVGSYVVNVIAPEQNFQDGAQADDGQENGQHFSHAITQNLVSSLQALQRAGEEYESLGKISVFEGAVRAGASANMCEALLGLSGEKR